MKGESRTANDILRAHGDAIRIVPLHMPEELRAVAAAPAAHLTYQNGPLISNVQIFTVYWGKDWATPPLQDLAKKLDAFFDYIVTSPLMDELSEYSVSGYTIGHGKHIGSTQITSPVLKHSVSDSAIQHMLQHEIATNSAFPQPTANTLYFVYLPTGVRVVQGGGSSCQAFCGYHSDIAGQIFYAAMPYPSCQGCTGGLSPFDALTSTSSHELCEAITDPIPGRGWYDDVHGEIGDICAWKTKKLGQYTVQLEWSNKSKNCI